MKLQIHLLNSNDIPLELLLNSKYISADEKASFDKYKNEMTKKEKIASTIFKKKYIGKYQLNEFGKPICDEKNFNISHSYGLVAFIMDDAPVGIDIETIRPIKPSLNDYVSSDEEKNYIHDEESFFEIWTNKEALVKAEGCGIMQKVDTIPALPINGIKEYKGKRYRAKTVRYQDCVITVAREKEEDFSIEIVEETI